MIDLEALSKTTDIGEYFPSEEYPEESLYSVNAGAGAIQLSNDGDIWYRTWDRTNAVSFEKQVGYIPVTLPLNLVVVILANIKNMIDKWYDEIF